MQPVRTAWLIFTEGSLTPASARRCSAYLSQSGVASAQHREAAEQKAATRSAVPLGPVAPAVPLLPAVAAPSPGAPATPGGDPPLASFGRPPEAAEAPPVDLPAAELVGSAPPESEPHAAITREMSASVIAARASIFVLSQAIMTHTPLEQRAYTYFVTSLPIWYAGRATTRSTHALTCGKGASGNTLSAP